MCEKCNRIFNKYENHSIKGLTIFFLQVGGWVLRGAKKIFLWQGVVTLGGLKISKGAEAPLEPMILDNITKKSKILDIMRR